MGRCFYVTKCDLPHMLENAGGGSIINIGSMAAGGRIILVHLKKYKKMKKNLEKRGKFLYTEKAVT